MGAENRWVSFLNPTYRTGWNADFFEPDYVRLLCGSLGNLFTAFAELNEQALNKAHPISRNNHDTELLRRVRALLSCQDEVATNDRREAEA